MAAFIDGCNSPWIGSYLDVGNVLVNGYPEDWITTLGPRISSVHVKDFLESVGNIHGFVPLFSGDVHWSSDVRAALAAIGYDGYLIAEVGPPSVGQQRFLEDTARGGAHVEIVPIGFEVTDDRADQFRERAQHLKTAISKFRNSVHSAIRVRRSFFTGRSTGRFRTKCRFICTIGPMLSSWSTVTMAAYSTWTGMWARF